ncbi:MAG: hypothetical protein E3J36_01340 [Candidatus Nealsonbacteria bacterium]|nr:MAG: hypothetical protein E3J36_01340 [Candidatus Nealsonbacteria bacterium]
MRKKFIIFLILLATLAGIAGFYYWQKNIYSKEVLKLEILGSEETALAQEIEYIVKYKNNGNVRLEEPKLIFECPSNSLECLLVEKEESPEEKKSLRKDLSLQTIYPGEEQALRIRARLLGKEGEAKIAKATLSYRPKNLKARYESITTFTTLIKSVPLTFTLDLPSKIESGKRLKFALNYFSNIDYPLSSLRCKIEYPPGFEFIESAPQSLEKIEWEIPPLNKAEGGRIEIAGRLSGEVGEQKIFHAEFGTWQEGEFILLKEAVKGIVIIKPSLYISQQINGNPEYTASPGDSLHYEIFFKNIGEETLNNLFLVTSLEGKAFDFQTIKAPSGEFELGDNSIVFDWRRVPRLQFLPPQEEGEVEFWIELKEDWKILSPEDRNPVVKNKIYLSQARKEFVTKVNSKLEITQKGYFQDEIFGNSGPLPPKTGKTTTYTIIWQAKNYYNNVENVKIKATLPKNVKLTGKIFPAKDSERFTFDSQSREIVWDIGELNVGQGIFNSAPTISFQIALAPDSAQKGQTPEIIREAKITAEDSWTKESLEATAPAINTTLPDDETVTEEMGQVQ